MPEPADQPALSIQRLRYRYRGAEREVIDLPELTLARGEQALVVGRSGSGKSTLLHLIAGLIEPARGCVRIAGTDIHALRGGRRDAFRGQRLGMIFQTHHLLAGFSAIENVMAALMFSALPPREHHDRAAALLTELGIDRPDARPDQLSVGQQQRVAVARALACEPMLVLADEPTASLDPLAAADAVGLIRAVCARHQSALLCVSHDPAVHARFERVALTMP